MSNNLIILFLLFSIFICLIQGNYEKSEYGNGYSNEYEPKYGQGRRIIDDYVCDLDASVLVVTSSDNVGKKGLNGYNNNNKEENNYQKYPSSNGYEEIKRTKRSENEYNNNKYGQQQHSIKSYKVAKAHRLRCSIIASGSDEDCKKCCHMAARKDRSISKDSILGFIVDYDEINISEYTKGYNNNNNNNGYLQTPYRSKRDTSNSYTPTPNTEEYKKEEEEYKQSVTESYASPPSINYQNYYNNYPIPKNPRCVCCSPRVYSVHKNNEEYYDNNNYGKKKLKGYYGSEEYLNKQYNNNEEYKEGENKNEGYK
ncbi:hypothetical protein Mgra_00002138 [Meloidogyne graminicola]|uniref:Uncharacterized protein n=1 Tax=Meloidogyne graminicola TaxID=189291 RepID=A0A8S9ZXR2_9BILA|nr:hypothetical protein Mgra_00002138 [Meloidogyne graminicola]